MIRLTAPPYSANLQRATAARHVRPP
jgi:hypothetical protein